MKLTAHFSAKGPASSHQVRCATCRCPLMSRGQLMAETGVVNQDLRIQEVKALKPSSVPVVVDGRLLCQDGRFLGHQ